MSGQSRELDLPDIDEPDEVVVEWLETDPEQCFIQFKPMTNGPINISLLVPAARGLRDALNAYLKDAEA